MSYIKGIQNIFLKWYLDAALAVYLDFKSHTGPILTMVKGAIISLSRRKN